MMDTYNSFIDRINDEFASLHLQIQRFEEGFYDDLAPFATKNELWPIMWLVPEDVSFLENSVSSYNIRVYFLDLLEKDESNERDVLSDQLSIARDFTNWLREDTDNKFNLLTEPTLVPVKSVIMDFTAGWYCDMNIEVETEMSECTIPFGLTSSTPVGCDPVTININGTFFTSVAGGTIYNQEIQSSAFDPVGTNTNPSIIADSVVSNSNVTRTYSIPAEQNETFADTNIQSSSSSFTDTTPSGDPAGYTIADVNWTDSDLATYSTEYSQPIVCTPQVKDLFLSIQITNSTDTASFSVVPNTAGTITVSDYGGLSSPVTTINGVISTVPFTLADTDNVEITYTTATFSTYINFTGTYV